MAVIYKQLIMIEIIFTANRRSGVLCFSRQCHVYTISAKKLEQGMTSQRNIWKQAEYSPVVEMQK